MGALLELVVDVVIIEVDNPDADIGADLND
jgi:hypothetical protein